MIIDKYRVGVVFALWAFFVALASVGLNVPTILLIIATILLLIP